MAETIEVVSPGPSASNMKHNLSPKSKVVHEKEDCNASEMIKPLFNKPDKDMNESSNCPSQESNEFKTPLTNFATPLSLSASSSIPVPGKKSRIENGGEKNKAVSPTAACENDIKSFSSKDSLQRTQPSVDYDVPEWSGETLENYSFDVLKNGTIIDSIPLKGKPYFIFGRLPSCDVTLEHPSLSRYHAVIQYAISPTATQGKGWYIYDLDSTHGTWVNKRKVNPKVYHRIKVGHIVKFGGSSRLHILQGPEEDADKESEMSITEMKEQKERQKREAELLHLNEKQEEQERAEKERRILEDNGCGWGMGEDAKDLGDENPFASLTSENENLYIDDPKKALKSFYEREGIDLPDYQFTDMSAGSHKCTLEIPVDGPNGEELIAEAVVSGKKRDAVIACALEACRMLDKLGMLRSSTHESRKRKERNWEDNDFYDSDEDTFLDRTGTIEKKRSMRMKKAGKDAAETYESLMMKHTQVTENIQDIERKLEKAKAEADALANEEMDELDAYMTSIKCGIMDSKTRLNLKGELLRLKMEEQKLRRLVNIAKPASLPPLKPLVPATSREKISTTESLSRKLQQLQKQKQIQKKPLPIRQTVVDMKPDEYEEEDPDDDENESEERSTSPQASDSSQIKQSEGHSKQKDKSSVERVSHEKSPGNTSTVQKSLSNSSSVETVKPKSKKSSHHFSASAALETIDKQQPSLKQAQPKPSHSSVDLDALDPKFATWLPPKEQTGDGRTSLNDKFGY